MSLHLEHRNPEQLAAVTAPDEHALILAVTFTNKAAREMLTRVSAMLPANPRGMWIICHNFGLSRRYRGALPVRRSSLRPSIPESRPRCPEPRELCSATRKEVPIFLPERDAAPPEQHAQAREAVTLPPTSSPT